MSIVSNAFKVPNRPSTISRYDCRHHDLSRIDGTAPYPSCKDILACVSAEHGNSDSLEDCYNSDALFGFAIWSHLDSIACQGRIENDPILSRIINIGLYDWKAPDCKGGGNQPSVPIPKFTTSEICGYLAWLSKFSNQPLLWLRLIMRTSSAIKTRFDVVRWIKGRSLCRPGWIDSSTTWPFTTRTLRRTFWRWNVKSTTTVLLWMRLLKWYEFCGIHNYWCTNSLSQISSYSEKIALLEGQVASLQDHVCKCRDVPQESLVSFWFLVARLQVNLPSIDVRRGGVRGRCYVVRGVSCKSFSEFRKSNCERVDKRWGWQWHFREVRTLFQQGGSRLGGEASLSGTWIFQTFQTFTFTRLTLFSIHDLRL